MLELLFPLHMKLLRLQLRKHLRNWLKRGRYHLLRSLRLHKSQKILTLQSRVEKFGHQLILFLPSLMTEVRNHAMLACQCLPLLNRVMAWVMSSLFYGSSAAFHVTVPILLRYASCCVLTMVPVSLVLTTL